MDEISPILVEKYKRDRRASKTVRGTERAPSTVNRELELLSKVFSLAIDQGLAIHNPCQKVKRFREDNERNRYLSDEEEPRLLSVLPLCLWILMFQPTYRRRTARRSPHHRHSTWSG